MTKKALQKILLGNAILTIRLTKLINHWQETVNPIIETTLFFVQHQVKCVITERFGPEPL